jgi:addiction module RelB/DinJ family antitoxin
MLLKSLYEEAGMTQKTRTNIYIDEEIKAEAKEFFRQYGISLSNGVNLLLKKMIQEKRLPPPVMIRGKASKSHPIGRPCFFLS